MERVTRLFRLREGWLMVGLLALIIFSVTWSIERADWAEGLRILSPVTLVGLLTGLILAKIRGVPRLLLHAVGMVAGAITVLWFAAGLIDDPALPTLQDRVQNLLGRVVTWGSAFVASDMSDDVWVFILGLAVLTYLLAYSGSWFLFRSRWLWWAIVPGGLALVVNISYSSEPAVRLFFVLYMIGVLLLMVRFNMLLHEEQWDRERVNYSPNLRWSFLWVGSLFAGAVAVSMWFVPPQAVNNTLNSAWESVNGPWVELQERFSRAFSGVSGGGNFGYSSFNSSFALGGSLNLGDSITLRIKSPRPLYWRAMTYDNWNGIGWTNTAETTFQRPNISSKLSLDANQQLISTDLDREPVTVTVTVIQPKVNQNGSIIFAPQRPVEASLSTRLDVSWEDKNVTYRVPGDDPNAAELELRPVLSLFTEARRAGMTRHDSDGWMPDPGDELAARQVLATLGADAAIETEIGKLRDRGIQVTYHLEADLTFAVNAAGPFPQYDDVTAVYAHDPIARGAQYTLVAEPSNVDIEHLRAAGIAYPSWVRSRYLQLPAELPQRVVALARQVAGDAQARTPYDIAVAIQDYLRANYTYSTNIKMPPPAVDKVDYFLFEQKVGYCEYYASAMVVMLRALGVPARMASGYAPGAPDPISDEFVVKESSSHAWPEVYFPQYGWIEFEPTPSQQVIVRPETAATADVTPEAGVTPGNQVNPVNRDPERNQGDNPSQAPGGGGFLGLGGGDPGNLVGGVLLIALAVVIAWYVVRRRSVQRARAAGKVLVTGAGYYERLVRLASWIGVRPRPSETPFEFADDLGREVAGSRVYVTAIAEAYVNERFGRRQLDVMDELRLDRAWNEVRRRLLRRLSNARQFVRRSARRRTP